MSKAKKCRHKRLILMIAKPPEPKCKTCNDTKTVQGEINDYGQPSDILKKVVDKNQQQIYAEETQKLEAENKRLKELLYRYHICIMCGKQLSVFEYKSVHTCYDEQTEKAGGK